jgi:hypothetical protein
MEGWGFSGHQNEKWKDGEDQGMGTEQGKPPREKRRAREQGHWTHATREQEKKSAATVTGSSVGLLEGSDA